MTALLGDLPDASAGLDFRACRRTARGKGRHRDRDRRRHPVHQGPRHRAQARPDDAEGREGPGPGGDGHSRGRLASGQQAGLPVHHARFRPPRLRGDLAPVPVLPQGDLPGPGSGCEGGRPLGEEPCEGVQHRPRAHRCDRVLGRRPPGADAGPDRARRRAGGRRVGGRPRQPGEGGGQFLRADRPGGQRHPRGLEAAGAGTFWAARRRRSRRSPPRPRRSPTSPKTTRRC